MMKCDIPNNKKKEKGKKGEKKKSPALMSPLPHPTTFPFEARAELALNFVHDSF